MIRAFLLGAALLFTSGAVAVSAETRKPETTLPYLGPGADKMSAADYERVYKNYIQTSVLLGYPFFKEKAPPCDQALSAIFRAAGLFGYPVPSEAQDVQRSAKGGIETYALAGTLIQVARNKSKSVEKLVLVNSSSVKATRRLIAFAKKELLTLDRDPKTGLERVHGLPVGYPHPYLTKEGQGLYVKVLRFSGDGENCRPEDFADNSWVGGFDLSRARCTDLQTEAEKVWSEQMTPAEFSQHEIDRMKAAALKAAMSGGASEAIAKAVVEKNIVPPLTNEINVVGSAMRNLAQCNLLALGRAGGVAPKGAPARGGETAPPSDKAGSAGSAQ